MLSVRLLNHLRLGSFLQLVSPTTRVPGHLFSTEGELKTNPGFDEALLEVLGDPLTKEKLRYDPTSSSLISDSTGVSYPVVNGMPWLDPQHGTVIDADTPEEGLAGNGKGTNDATNSTSNSTSRS